MFKKLLGLGAAVALLSGVWTAQAVAEVRPGAAAPDFTAKTADGANITLSELKGKTVVLEWLNYECPFVAMHYGSGNLPELQGKYTQQGVVWLAVAGSAEGKQGYYTAGEYAAKNRQHNSKASHVVLDADGTIGQLYGAKTTPHIFVIDGQGVVQYNGAIDSIPSIDADTLAEAIPHAANAIDAVLAGKTPEPAATTPYGCSVKYPDTEGYNKQ